MNSVSGVRPRLNVNLDVLNKKRRASELPPKRTVNPRAKVIKTKKIKGTPADPDTLLGVINYFREQFGQNPLEVEEALSDFIIPIANEEKVKIILQDRIVISHSCLVKDFNGQSAPALVKSWISSPSSLQSLIMPASSAYCDIVQMRDGTERIVFISVLCFT